jgi:hypothetical protein
MKPVKPQARLAVEVIYHNLNSLPHPDHGLLRLMYFGHTSDGQRTITRATAEALVMLLEANGFHVCNGLTEAADLLRSNGYVVVPLGEAPQEYLGESAAVPATTPANGDDDVAADLLPVFSDKD